MWSHPFVHAVFALVAAATTSVDGVSVPAHFFEYGIEARDTPMVRTDGFTGRFPLPSAFTYQGVTVNGYEVSVFILCCIETIRLALNILFIMFYQLSV